MISKRGCTYPDDELGDPIDGAHRDLVHRVLIYGRRRLRRAPPVLEVSRRARQLVPGDLGLAAGVAIAAARSASHRDPAWSGSSDDDAGTCRAATAP